MENETRLKILKISCIYGGVFSLVLVGLYVLLRYRCDGAPLSVGWQTVGLERSDMRYD